MKIVFMGTPEFALTALKSLVDAGHNIVCVYTRAPKPSGRGHKETPSPVHSYALEKGLPVRCPATLRTDEAFADFAALDAELAVVAAYGMILPAPFLTAFKYGCWNIHGSLLPRWRGAAPIQRAVMEGDEKTGVTLMQMDAGMDTGDILLQKEISITSETTSGTLYEDLADLGARALAEGLERLKNGTLSSVKQPAEGVTYAAKIQKEEGLIDWSLSAKTIDHRLRGLTPLPGAWFMNGEDRVFVLKTQVVPLDRAAPAGTVLDDALLIACGKDALRLLDLKKAGKREMNAKDFLNGNKISAGTVL